MGGGGRRLVPGKEGRNRRERLFSKERIERFLRPNMEARKRDEKCVSKGRSGCLLGSARGDRNRDDRFASMEVMDASWAPEKREKARRAVRLKGAQWTPPRPWKGEPKMRRVFRFTGGRWVPPGSRQDCRKRGDRFISRGSSGRLFSPDREG